MMKNLPECSPDYFREKYILVFALKALWFAPG